MSAPSRILLSHLRRLAAPALADAALLARWREQRDHDAFALLMARHGPMVLGVCRRILGYVPDAEDAFQATFLVLARKAAQLRRPDALASFLYGVALRLARKARAAAKRRKMVQFPAEAPEPIDPRPQALDVLSGRELLALLDAEIARLPEAYRLPLLLCLLQGRTIEEAARQLGWSIGSLRGRLERGRERLRLRLSRRGLGLSVGAIALLTPATVPEKVLAESLRQLSGPVPTAVGILASPAISGLKWKIVCLGLLLITAAGLGMGLPLLPTPAPVPETPAARTAPAPLEQTKHEPRRDRYGDPLPPGAVARIGTVRWWCGRIRGELVNTLVYAPDGKSLVFSDDRDTVHFLDATTGKEQRRIVVPEVGRRACFALAPNGKTLVTANLGSPAFHVWDVRTGKELRRIEGVTRGVDALAFTPNGKTFAVGTHADIWLWDTATWKEIRRIAGKDVGHYGGIHFLADGKTLISGFSNRISWWDTATGQVIRRISMEKYGRAGGFSHPAVSPDGKRLAVVVYRSSNLLLLWDAATGKEVRRIEFDPMFTPSCLCFSPDSRLLACGSSDNGRGYWSHQTLFFSAATGAELHRWDEDDDHASQLAFSPDGKILAQAMSSVLRLRDVKTGKPIVPVRGLPNSCLAVRFGRDGKSLIAGCRGGRIGTWNPFTGEPLTPLRDPPEGFGRQSFAPLGTALTAHGEKAALVNAKDTLHVWEPATGKVYCRIADPPVGLDQADFSPDGKMVAVKHQDDIIRLWDARTGKLILSLPRVGSRFPHPRAFSPDGRTLAIGPAHPEKGIIHLYQTATGKEEGRFIWRDSTDVNCLLFTPDGKYLLAAHRRRMELEGGPPERGDEEDALRLWDRESGREVRRIRMPVHWHQAITISRDGKTVAASVGDTIILWELASGTERGRFSGHREWIRSLAFSPDGRLLASGSADHTACVWDITGICPDGHQAPRRVKQDELEHLWMDLGNKDGVRAYRALWRLAAAGPPTVAFLAQRLGPAPRVKNEQLTRLIADLDSDSFEIRERAARELQQLGEQAEPSLRKALEGKPSLEASRRLRALLNRVERRTLSAEQLHALRAVEVLEHIGSPEAQQVLRTLAEAAPRAVLTSEAKASLERLTRRQQNK